MYPPIYLFTYLPTYLPVCPFKISWYLCHTTKILYMGLRNYTEWSFPSRIKGRGNHTRCYPLTTSTNGYTSHLSILVWPVLWSPSLWRDSYRKTYQTEKLCTMTMTVSFLFQFSCSYPFFLILTFICLFRFNIKFTHYIGVTVLLLPLTIHYLYNGPKWHH